VSHEADALGCPRILAHHFSSLRGRTRRCGWECGCSWPPRSCSSRLSGYSVYGSSSRSVRECSRPPGLTLGTVNTLVLITSSLTVALPSTTRAPTGAARPPSA